LEIHKREEGNLTPNLEMTNLADLINEVMAQFDFMAKQNQVLLSVNRSEDLCMISIDRNLIKRVIDRGNGLAPEYHQRIFNKFEQIRLKQEGCSGRLKRNRPCLL
jgi:signal transduction histidine kinase